MPDSDKLIDVMKEEPITQDLLQEIRKKELRNVMVDSIKRYGPGRGPSEYDFVKHLK